MDGMQKTAKLRSGGKSGGGRASMRACDAKLAAVFADVPSSAVSQLADVLSVLMVDVPQCEVDGGGKPKAWSHVTQLQRLIPVLACLTSDQLPAVEEAIVNAVAGGMLPGWSPGVLRLVDLGARRFSHRANHRAEQFSELLGIIAEYPPSHVQVLIERFRDDREASRKRPQKTAARFADGLNKLIAPDPGRDSRFQEIAGMLPRLSNSQLEAILYRLRTELEGVEDPKAPLDDRLPTCETLTPDELELLVLYAKLTQAERTSFVQLLARSVKVSGVGNKDG